MAMHAGIGISRLLLLAGAGYSGTVMLSNGKLSDLLGHLQELIKGIEKKGGATNSEADAITAEVQRLAAVVRDMASSRQITILNSDSGRAGNLSCLVMPAAVLGAAGYGYMWLKGYSFSDLMYVTKHNMNAAVESMTKHLEQVSEKIAATKKHLTQRIQGLDDKLDEQKEMSKLIKNEVTDVRTDLSQINFDLDTLQRLVSGLDGKIMSLEDKQDIANAGVYYLCNFVAGKDGKTADIMKTLPKPNKPRVIGYEAPSLNGLKQIADTMAAAQIDKSTNVPRSLSRTASLKC
ncbi:hypothetical protein ACHQM5_006127 [Ranunculus cassubicifolius]